ncbi:alpha beta hydrolase fold-1 protein [Diplodia corticola]|uniref:Alpha beta hydrolase fold-1 protein n=1 Tax=Diplodia corticola TaxID=236234 RepID=A0A1J9QXP3_9PEZI|nr:alpha beta hydrolase fold-1 protein [Diplodia corticola]OJD33160.1 alpha beta hydrolase fold-1 protein [Diplodia corticola]
MEGLTRKTFTTSRALTYTYWDTEPATPRSSPSSAPTSPTSSLASARTPTGANSSRSSSSNNDHNGYRSKPPILFLHGFPDSAFLWSPIMSALRPLSHRMIAPDMLGHGATSKPADPAAYTSDLMTADLVELLASEGIGRAIVVGHDWGAFVAQRMWLWRGPALVAGLVLVSIAYMPPDRESPFNLEYLNYALEEATGHARYAYWEFFSEPDAPAVTQLRAESLWTALHGSRPNCLRDIFCTRGAVRKFLEADCREEVRDYAADGSVWKNEYMARIRESGFAGAFNWYKVYVLGLNWEKERHIRGDRLKVRAPTLFVACSRDDICLPSFIEPSRQAGLLPDLEIAQIDASHWATMEKPDEVSHALSCWLKERWS